MSQHRAAQWPGLIAQARALLDDLERDGPTILLAASPTARFDGYPSTAAGAGDGRGGGGDLGDRVASIIDTEDDVDAGQMRAHLLEALRSLRRADSARLNALRPPKAPAAKPAAHEAPGCVNCARFDIYAVATKAGRCDACYMYRYRHDRDAPDHVVLARPVNRPAHARGPAEEIEAAQLKLAGPTDEPEALARAFGVAGDLFEPERVDAAASRRPRSGQWFGTADLLDTSRVVVDDEGSG